MTQRTQHGFSAPDTVLLALIDKIYCAATAPALWRDLMPDIVEFVGATKGQLFHPNEDATRNIWAPHGMSFELMEVYGNYYHTMDEWVNGFVRLGSPTERALVTDQLVDRRKLAKTEYHNDFLARFDIGEICACMVEFGPDKSPDVPPTALAVYRGVGAQPFGEDEARRLSMVTSHVRRALRLHWRIGDLEHKNATNTEALENLATGVALIGENLKVTYLNPAARTIVNAGDGLTVNDGELTAALSTERMELSRLLRETTQTTISLAASRTETMAVTRPNGKLPYRITAIPAPASGIFAIGRQHTAAIVFISGDQPGAQAGLDKFAEIYSLTPAEKRLLSALLNGAPLKRAARDLRISVNTAHTELQSIFRKTGTHRQVELVSLVAGVTGTNSVARTRDDAKHS
jgi:DNA-binding CsgD family transcriptional regulator/PAS domain-containing protein